MNSSQCFRKIRMQIVKRNVDALRKPLVGKAERDDCCTPLFSHVSVHVCDTVSNIQLNLA